MKETLQIDIKKGENIVSRMAEELFQRMVEKRQSSAKAELELTDPPVTITMFIKLTL